MIGVQDFEKAKIYKPTWTKIGLRPIFVLRWNNMTFITFLSPLPYVLIYDPINNVSIRVLQIDDRVFQISFNFTNLKVQAYC